jgi:hypothetical protein
MKPMTIGDVARRRGVRSSCDTLYERGGVLSSAREEDERHLR